MFLSVGLCCNIAMRWSSSAIACFYLGSSWRYFYLAKYIGITYFSKEDSFWFYSEFIPLPCVYLVSLEGVDLIVSLLWRAEGFLMVSLLCKRFVDCWMLCVSLIVFWEANFPRVCFRTGVYGKSSPLADDCVVMTFFMSKLVVSEFAKGF